MESFRIHAMLNGQETEILVIPDDSYDRNIFHLVSGGDELCKVEYVNADEWKITDGRLIENADLQAIAHKTEMHY